MRNDFQEAFDAIEDINEELAETICKYKFDPEAYHEMELDVYIDGSEISVEFAGVIIWNNNNDDRKYIDEKNNIKEPLISFLRSKIDIQITFFARVLENLKTDRKEWRTLND